MRCIMRNASEYPTAESPQYHLLVCQRGARVAENSCRKTSDSRPDKDYYSNPFRSPRPGSNRPDAEPGPDNTQLVATIKKTDASPEGPVLTITDKDRDRKITIGPDTAIWIARAARITDIKVGSAVTMTGVKREDGSLQVLRATFGPAGAGKPPL